MSIILQKRICTLMNKMAIPLIILLSTFLSSCSIKSVKEYDVTDKYKKYQCVKTKQEEIILKKIDTCHPLFFFRKEGAWRWKPFVTEYFKKRYLETKKEHFHKYYTDELFCRGQTSFTDIKIIPKNSEFNITKIGVISSKAKGYTNIAFLAQFKEKNKPLFLFKGYKYAQHGLPDQTIIENFFNSRFEKCD